MEDKKLTKEELREKKKKAFLEGIEAKNVSDIVFKPENLGALEFNLGMVTKKFELEEVPFRIERITSDTFLKITEEKNDIKGIEKTLNAFIAFPVEARNKEFFNLDTEAMGGLVELILDFQQTPFLFIENFKEDKRA